MKPRLSIELVPEKQWGKSLAQWLPKEEWNVLRRKIYRRYSWTCQVCGAFGVRVHCHESWSWDDRKKIQKLVDLGCRCEDCHHIHHWGRTIHALHEGKLTQTYIDKLRKHYCQVNNCTERDMIDEIVRAGDRNLRRSRYTYKLDFSRLRSIVKETEACLKIRKEYTLGSL